MFNPYLYRRMQASKQSFTYRNSVISCLILLVLSLLLHSENSSASTILSQPAFIKNVGYQDNAQKQIFVQAQQAFKNKDFNYSIRLLKNLALQGHAKAQYLLATQYDAGLGVTRDVSASFYWYKKAAESGETMAQHNVAVAFAQGIGTEVSLKKAIKWWKRAAMHGNADSQYNLGVIYATGKGSITPDLKRALKWWRMAAINGDAIAQFNLGALYANGIGMSSRTCEASRWWKKSAENGFEQAEMALAVLQTKSDYDICR